MAHVRIKRVVYFVCEILVFGHFFLNLYFKRIQTWHFPESSGCRLLIAVYVISVGHLQLEKLRFKKRLLHLKSGKFVFFSFLHRVLRVRAVLPIEYPLSNCTDACLEASQGDKETCTCIVSDNRPQKNRGLLLYFSVNSKRRSNNKVKFKP